MRLGKDILKVAVGPHCNVTRQALRAGAGYATALIPVESAIIMPSMSSIICIEDEEEALAPKKGR